MVIEPITGKKASFESKETIIEVFKKEKIENEYKSYQNINDSLTFVGSGFAGYSFNNGNGYANTIFAHANFLAGKKIKLLEKILTAIADVDTIYDQITSKRSEYYEYNQ